MKVIANLFVKLMFAVLVIYGLLLLNIYNSRLYDLRLNRKDISNLNHKSLKYILQWTSRFTAPFYFMGEGNSAFIKNKCKYTNCFVTDDSNYFINQSDFDAIAFNGRDVIHLWEFQMPKNRSPKQKYIFGAMESPDNYPACDENLEGFFNWTWTYRLDSDFRWGYITIYDLNGNTVGPKIDMHWPKLKPIEPKLKYKLSSKTKAVAWFVSNCKTINGREYFVKNVQKQLIKYGWTVDVYGRCGNYECPRSDEKSCFKMIEDDYHFYFSFENSFSEDYVTEKLLTALNNYAVPIVFGAANYSRFLPNGSYLDANKLGAKKLARTISDIMRNRTKYYDFFRWRNHYVYKVTSDNVDICKLCAMMNDDHKIKEISVWNDFRIWWNGKGYKRNCPQ